MDFELTPEPPIKLTENHVEQACLDVLECRGYWPARLHAGRYIHADKAVIDTLHAAGVPIRWMTGAERGTPDWAFLHSARPGFLMEVKRPGGKLRPEQAKKIQYLKLWPLEIAVVDRVEALLDWLKERGRL